MRTVARVSELEARRLSVDQLSNRLSQRITHFKKITFPPGNLHQAISVDYR